MSKQPVFDTAAIAAAEARDATRLSNLSMQERGDRLIDACRAAAAIEASRLKMGFPPIRPAPWPDSTWQFLAQTAERLRSCKSHE